MGRSNCTSQSSAHWPQLGTPRKIQTRSRGEGALAICRVSSSSSQQGGGPCRGRCDNSMRQSGAGSSWAMPPRQHVQLLVVSRARSCCFAAWHWHPHLNSFLSPSPVPSLSCSRTRPGALQHTVVYPSNVRLCGLSGCPSAEDIDTPAGGFCNLQASFWNARRRLRKNG